MRESVANAMDIDLSANMQDSRKRDSILDSLDLYDVASLQSTHPVTYFRHHSEHTRARYDRIYVTPSIFSGVRIRLLPRTGDHTPDQMVLAQNNAPKIWRFPDQLLDDPAYVQRLHDTIRQTLRKRSYRGWSQPGTPSTVPPPLKNT